MKLTEDQIHASIVQFWAVQAPDAIVHHSRNEGSRGGKAGIIDGTRGKRIGVVKGYPDLIIHWRGVTFFIEVKREGAYLDKAQKSLHEELRKHGLRVFVCRSVDDAQEVYAEMKVAPRPASV